MSSRASLLLLLVYLRHVTFLKRSRTELDVEKMSVLLFGNYLLIKKKALKIFTFFLEEDCLS